MTHEQRLEEEQKLLENIRARLPELQKLMHKCSGENGYEDRIYRFYHGSIKVGFAQVFADRILEQLKTLAPHLPLNDWFLQIVEDGSKASKTLDNDRWSETARPIIEAYFHARFFLEMVCRYGSGEAKPFQMIEVTPGKPPGQFLASGWAAVCELYGIR